MIVNRHDTIVGAALLRTGVSYDHKEIDLLIKILCVFDGPRFVVDAGANVGAFSLAFSKAVGTAGKVHAFEAQRIVFNMLAGSVALNGIENVFCHNVALGDVEGEIEIPQFDYNRPLSFVSIEFGDKQKEKLSQERGDDKIKRDKVRLARLDSFAYPLINLIKIDVEGMEAKVLDGAVETIKKSRPVIHLEWIKSDRAALVERFKSLDYTTYRNEANLVCIPNERKSQFNSLFHK